MGKLPYMYTDSEETEDASSSVENIRKRKRFSILKFSNGNVKKKKCKVHSISEPEETESRTRSNCSVRKLRGILKHDRERESSDEEGEEAVRPLSKYLVGRVPRAPGGRPGRGGGLAIVIRKNTDQAPRQSLQAQSSSSSTKKFRSTKRLAKKRSY